jgi:hypothetical protein
VERALGAKMGLDAFESYAEYQMFSEAIVTVAAFNAFSEYIAQESKT